MDGAKHNKTWNLMDGAEHRTGRLGTLWMVPSTQEDLVPNGWCQAQEDLEPNGWCRVQHKETWYLMDGAEHKETWHLMDGAKHSRQIKLYN